MSQAARKHGTLSGPYGEADLDGEESADGTDRLESERCSYAPEPEELSPGATHERLRRPTDERLQRPTDERLQRPTDEPLRRPAETLEESFASMLEESDSPLRLGEFGDTSDIYTLMVPPGGSPDDALPGSIEEAIRQVIDQVPRSSPELPPEAYEGRPSTIRPPPMPLSAQGDEAEPASEDLFALAARLRRDRR